MNTNDMMAVIDVPVILRDGGSATLKANKFTAEKLHLKHAVVHPFTNSHGDKILYILEDGTGHTFVSEKDNVGISLPHLITGQKGRFGYNNNDPFDVTSTNIRSRRNKH